MAWTQVDLDALDAAIANTDLLVSFGDRKVRYKDMRDLIKARNLVYNTIRAAAGEIVPCIKVCNLAPQSNL